MSYLYKIMTHDKNDVGWEDDSFAEGWSAGWCSLDTNGDTAEIAVDPGYTGGRIQKTTGINVDAATYKYMIVCLRGTDQYYLQVYDGEWRTVCAYPDAPSEYDAIIYDLTSITTGTITGVRLGVYGGELEKCLYDFVAFMKVQPLFAIDKILEIVAKQRETDIDGFEIVATDDVGSGLTIARRVRIWLAGVGNAEKVFAGVIEEATPGEGPGKLKFISGRGFGQELLLRPKTESFENREVSLAAKDLVEDLAEITTYQVDTPSPSVTVTKDFNYEYIMDGLKELAKQAGSQWEVKLGMGHDLRFRDRSNAPSLPLQISESSGHILSGVRKESDGYRTFNKVTVIGGNLLNDDGDPDKWTESTTGWSVQNGTISVQADGPVGDYFLRINFANQNQVWCDRSITSLDTTKYKSLKFYLRADVSGDTWNVWIEIGQNSNNCKTFPLKALGGGLLLSDYLIEFEIPLDHPAWSATGSPNMSAVTWICIHPGCIAAGNISGDVDFDGLHFWNRNVVKSATDSGSGFRHTREYVHRDDKLIDPSFVQEVANALSNILKDKENRYRLPLVGMAFVKVKYKANVQSPTWGLSGDYHIVEAIHRVSPISGYVTDMVLESPPLYLEKLLAEVIERKIKLIERGTIQ
jgi:hypothetical protein